MHIKKLRNTQIDKDLWDKRITESTTPFPYALSYYLDIVSPGWSALVTHDYEWVMPITDSKKLWYTFLMQPLYCQQLGIFGKQDPPVDVIKQFVQKIKGQYALLQYQMNFKNPLTSNSFQVKERVNFCLPLQGSYEQLAAEFSGNHKRNLQKAEEHKITVQPTPTEAVLALFYAEKAKSIGLKQPAKTMLNALLQTLEARDMVKSLGAYHQGKLVAGNVWITFKDTFYYLIPGSTHDSKRLGASFKLIDFMIQAHQGTTKQIDFEGSMQDGVARFYRGFGAKAVVYYLIKENNLPFWMQPFVNLRYPTLAEAAY